MSTIINENILKRIESLAEKSNQDINAYLENVIEELEFIESAEEAWREIEHGEYKTFTSVEELMKELNSL